MSALNIVFSKLEKFTGNGSLDLRTWLPNFERCCVIADKKDDLVKGQLLMMCIDGRARAILDQYEEQTATPQKFTDLKKQLEEIFDSPADREAKMTEFKTRIQHIDETEEEFMTVLLQLYHAANPEAKSEDVNSAMKCKFLHGINDTLCCNIFIFCTNPFSDDVSPQVPLKASRDAVVHLSASVSSSSSTPTKSSLSAQAAVFPTASAATLTPQLDKVIALTQQPADQAKITNGKLDQQQQEINFLKQNSFQPPYGPNFQTSRGHGKYQQHFRGRTHAPTRAHFGGNSASGGNSQPGVNQQTTILCHSCHQPNHFKCDCLLFQATKFFCQPARKLLVASVEGHTEAKTLRSTKTHSSPQDSPKHGTQLLWLKGHLNGQQLDMMLDSGATVCCLAKRCFGASPNLKHECLIPYNGPGLLDANGNFLRPCGIIKEPLTLGTPASSFSLEFFVIDSLPYSCILGSLPYSCILSSNLGVSTMKQ